MWNNEHVSRRVLTVFLLFFASAFTAFADESPQTPKLLLTAQRLRRLKRDRDRKTARWTNFENRLHAVPDSQERGFELALYYAVTGDEVKGREAVQWALGSKDQRQRALVLDWCAPLATQQQRAQLTVSGNPSTEPFTAWRDSLFRSVAAGDPAEPPADQLLENQLPELRAGGYRRSPHQFYALCELIYSERAAFRKDLRSIDPHFFSILPQLILLSAKPRELNTPPWQLHIAALALVAIDPNLPASQFLQSWALEDSQTLREGPGVAYELLWADPYLPGVGYQNMDTWLYDEHARLFARAGWDTDACWVEISPAGVREENCPARWQSETVTFGHLRLMPMLERCIEIPHLANNQFVLVWKLQPGRKVTIGRGKEQRSMDVDAAGIWRPGANVEGKACVAAH
jgi:hypothetical protein